MSFKQLSDKIYNGLSQSVMNDFASQHPGLYQRPWLMFDIIFNRHGTITAEHINAKKTLRAPFDTDTDPENNPDTDPNPDPHPTTSNKRKNYVHQMTVSDISLHPTPCTIASPHLTSPHSN